MLRYFSRYRAKAYRVLILLTSPENEDLTRAGEMLGEILKKNLRSSDLMMQCDKASFLVLLPTVTEQDISRVLDRIREKWENQAAGDMVSIRFEQEPVILPDAGQDGKNKGE
jgi:GGDEF domain-containing protein